MVETCVLTLGELMSGNIDKDNRLAQCEKIGQYFNDKKGANDNKKYKLVIPFYQRAYVWSEKMVKIMLEDIDEQRKEGKKYLLGSLIIHIIDKNNENETEFNIVDGQQRLTTLDLVLKFLTKELNLAETKLLDENKAGSIIGKEIADEKKQNESNKNDKLLTSKEKAEQTIKNWFENRDKNSFLEYLKGSIEFVCVFTDSIDDAFIFFDSANAKGVRLKAYDLIKAFHLRALEDTCKDKIPHYTRFFENLATRQDDLNILINLVLKPAREWINYKDKQDENIEETMRIYNEFCKEIPQRFRKDEPYPAHNSLGILQNFMGGADFFEYLKTL